MRRRSRSDPDYPKDPAFKARFGPRGVLKSKASDRDDPTVDPRFGQVGKQTIEDTGPLTKKRMETIDDETTDAAIDFIQRQVRANRPFFTWYNATRMHLYTHVRPSMLGRSGISEYFDGMLEHDDDVGKLLKTLDDLNIAGNTIVVYTTDNGPHMNSWPDGGYTPFRNEKNSNWEGAFRVPAFVRWPGHIAAGTVSNEMFSALDWFPTLLAAAGDTSREGTAARWLVDRRRELQESSRRLQPASLPDGAAAEVGAQGVLLFQRRRPARGAALRELEDGVLRATRRGHTAGLGGAVRVPPRSRRCINLRMDPYERADVTSNTYYEYSLERAFLVVPTQAVVSQFVATFRDFPPRQRPSSFSVDQIMDQILSKPQGG